jgi:hypothetical protein
MLLEPQQNLLNIAAQYNMDGPGMYDRDIQLSSAQGTAGRAFRDNKVRTFDKNENSHKDLGVLPGQERLIWKDLSSIISMPIRSRNANRLGVLNMDSDQVIDETKFRDDDVKIPMGLAADAFGRFLEKKI